MELIRSAAGGHRQVVGEAVLQVCLAGGQVGVCFFQLSRQRAAVLLARHQLVAQVRSGACTKWRRVAAKRGADK